VTAAVLIEPDLTGDESLAERAYRDIRRLIVTLDLAPGSVISEPELQERLGMGRTPIREALRRLANEHLVEVYPRRGMFVAALDTRDLTSISELREELEPFAARLAAARRNEEDIEVIDVLLDAIAATGNTPDMRDLIELDQRVHHHVYRCAHNEYVRAVLEQHYMHALRIWFLALDRVTHLHQAMEENRDLLVAIREGDAERAGTIMSSHVEGFEADVRRAI
jgi:GntR family transcriptional regulator, rspAB operon transcriptional repressor